MNAPNLDDTSKPNFVDFVVRECDRLSQPTTNTTMNELAKLQHDCIHYLLRLGPESDTIRQKIEELQFQYGYQPIWKFANTGQKIDAIVPFSWAAAGASVANARLSEYIAGVLNELKQLMLAACARQQPALPPSLQTIAKKSAKQTRSTKADDARSPTKTRARKKRKKKLTRSQVRALQVAQAIREIDKVLPQMDTESHYVSLAKEHSDFLIFRTANKYPKIRELLINVQSHRRHIRLAQQVVATSKGLALATIKNDWKKAKPRQFRNKK